MLARQRGWFAGWALLAAGAALWLHGITRTGLSAMAAVGSSAVLVAAALAGGSTGWPYLLAAIAAGPLLWLSLRTPLATPVRALASHWLLLALALLLLLMLAGAAHILTWSLLPVALLQAWRPARAAAPLWWLAGLPAGLLLGATALTFDLLIGYALPVVSVLPLLLLALLYAPLLSRSSAGPTGLAAMAVAGVALAALALGNPWSASRPEPVELFVLHEVGDGRSWWASSDRSLTGWHRDVLGETPQRRSPPPYRPEGNGSLWLAPLDGARVEGPDVQLVGDRRSPDRRALRIRIRPAAGGDSVTVMLPPDTDLRGWTIDGQPLQRPAAGAGRWWVARGYALPVEGVELGVELGPDAALPDVLLVGQRHGMPDGVTLPPRPPTLMRRPYSMADSTVSVRRVVLSPLPATPPAPAASR